MLFSFLTPQSGIAFRPRSLPRDAVEVLRYEPLVRPRRRAVQPAQSGSPFARDARCEPGRAWNEGGHVSPNLCGTIVAPGDAQNIVLGRRRCGPNKYRENFGNLDIEDYYLAASINGSTNPEFTAKFGGRYFNSGVMLINLARWRRDNVAGECERILEERPEDVLYGDQCLLNFTCRPWLEIGIRYNFFCGVGERWARKVGLSRREFRANARHPSIIHFVGPKKPWKKDPAALRELELEYGAYRQAFKEAVADQRWTGFSVYETQAQQRRSEKRAKRKAARRAEKLQTQAQQRRSERRAKRKAARRAERLQTLAQQRRSERQAKRKAARRAERLQTQAQQRRSEKRAKRKAARRAEKLQTQAQQRRSERRAKRKAARRAERLQTQAQQRRSERQAKRKAARRGREAADAGPAEAQPEAGQAKSSPAGREAADAGR